MSEKIKIDKHVKIPLGLARGYASKYPWADMNVGDSFLAPNRRPVDMSGSKRLAAQKYGFEFICRTVEGGTRVWRVK